MKKTIYLLFAFFLIGCGGGGGSSDPNSNNQPPIVSSQAASTVTVNTAVANGSVNPNGNATDAWFEWGTSSTLPPPYNTTPKQPIGAGVTSVAVNAGLSGLSAGTTYYYRSCASSNAGESKGLIVSFTTGTPAAPPTVQTVAATGIELDGAMLNGQVNPNGVASSGRFRWGYGSTTLTNLTSWIALGSGDTSVSASFNLTGQAPGTRIYYQAEGESSAGNTLGAVMNFTTLLPSVPPTVTTLGATNISQVGGTLNGQVNANGVASSGRFHWGYSSTTLTNLTPWVAVGAGTASVSIAFDLTGQSPGTPIYYQAEGESSAGNTLGATANFTTALAVSAPVATTGAATNITGSSADIGASVNPGNDPTSACFEWGTAPDLSSSSVTPTQSIGSDNSNHAMSETLGGFSDNTTVYYRVKAWNTVGTVWGSILSFTTGAAPEATTGSAVVIFSGGQYSATLNGNVTPNGLATSIWFEWGADPSFTNHYSSPLQSVGSGTTSQAVGYSTPSGLTAGVTIYYRIGASNSSGTTYGSTQSFTPGS